MARELNIGLCIAHDLARLAWCFICSCVKRLGDEGGSIPISTLYQPEITNRLTSVLSNRAIFEGPRSKYQNVSGTADSISAP